MSRSSIQPQAQFRQHIVKGCLTLMVFALLGCKPSAEVLCRDSVHCGEKPPAGLKVDYNKHALQKWNNHWFLVPRDYDAHFGMKFKWPSRTPQGRDPTKHDPNDWSIQLQIRSYDIPPEPRGYRAIELAEQDGRVVSRETVRPGLDRIQYFDLHPFTRERNRDLALTYVATARRTPEGLPPTLGCDVDPLNPAKGGAGAGFIWRDGIFVEVLIRRGHVCESWPELFDEVIRILELTEKV
jgi:hypothetical protein